MKFIQTEAEKKLQDSSQTYTSPRENKRNKERH